MSTLLLRIAAPMQAWGTDSKFDIRSTEREPSKSGIIGLLAAALGIRREEKDKLAVLSDLRFGVRADREGTLLHDFHMVHGEKSSYVTRRYYLCDAVFLVGLESDDDALLKDCAYALQHPVFPLFFGKRACPPTLPLFLGVRDCSLEEALQKEPVLVQNGENTLRVVLDAEKTAADAILKRDQPVSFSQRKREYRFRKSKESFVMLCQPEGPAATEHDAFGEVTVYDVSDTTGA